MNTNVLDWNNDILNIIGDYVKKDNHDRMQKICKKYVKLHEELDAKRTRKNTIFRKRLKKERRQ